MLIGVTGGAGMIGRAVIAELESHGHTTRSVDVGRGAGPAERYRRADLRQLWQAMDALDGVHAVVHLAGVGAPDGPTAHPLLAEQVTFAANTEATYNVFLASRALGIGHVVWASSETVMGCPFAVSLPDFLPLTEAHPVRPEYSYALAKAVGEQLSQYAARNAGTAVTALRFSMVLDDAAYADLPRWWDEPMAGAWNLWSYVDIRDVAASCRVAVEKRPDGAQTFIITASDTTMDRPTSELLALWNRPVAVRGDLSRFGALQSGDKAAALLGFRPEHGWRDHIST